MIYENDVFDIPEKYRKMSVSELRRESEKLYSEIKKSTNVKDAKKEKEKTSIVFYF